LLRAAAHLEARVALTRAPRGGRVDAVEVREHLRGGRVEAVEVESVEADLLLGPERPLIAVAHPAHEVEDVGVAPHPRGEAAEVAERTDGVKIAPLAADVAVDAQAVRPVALDGDGGEALLLDEPPR